MSTDEKNTETGFGDEFKKVESRKRKTDDKMDETAERPYFAPITAERMSSKKKALDIRTGFYPLFSVL